MIHNIKEARRIVRRNLPKGKIEKAVSYKNLYVFIVFTDDPYEGNMDGLYSVNKATGEFRDFAYLKVEVFDEIMSLFEKVNEEPNEN